MNTAIISQLTKENQDFIQQQISSGQHRDVLAVIQEAVGVLRDKQKYEQGAETLQELLKVGERDIKAGRVFKYSRGLIDRAFVSAQKNLKAGKPIPDEIKP